MAEHLDLVRHVKADLEAHGADLRGPCGAWAITSRVIWALRTEGAGGLEQLTGNNCAGRAAGIVCFADGQIVDILGDAGGLNIPIWSPADPVAPARWRLPVDPGDAVRGPGPRIPLLSPLPQEAPDPLRDFLAQISARLDALAAAIEVVRLDGIEARQELAIATNAFRLLLKDVVLRGVVDKKTGVVALKADTLHKPTP